MHFQSQGSGITAGIKNDAEKPCRLSFMGLPQEIRDKVYDYLWLETPILFCPFNGLLLRALYGELRTVDNLRTDGLPTWLLSSKAILREGLKQFSYYGKWLADPIIARYSYVPSLLASPPLVTRLMFNVKDLHAIIKLRKFTVIEPMRALFQDFFAQCHSLKSLAIDIGFLEHFYSHIDKSNWDESWSADLSFLEANQFPLQEVEFVIYAAWPRVQRSGLFTTYRIAMYEEFKRLSKFLIGENGRVAVDKMASPTSNSSERHIFRYGWTSF